MGRSLTKVREEPYKYPGKEHSGKEGTAGAKAATRNEVVMTAGERVGRSGGGEGLGGARRPAHGRREPAARGAAALSEHLLGPSTAQDTGIAAESLAVLVLSL